MAMAMAMAMATPVAAPSANTLTAESSEAWAIRRYGDTVIEEVEENGAKAVLSFKRFSKFSLIHGLRASARHEEGHHCSHLAAEGEERAAGCRGSE
jgi:hypothetical protein